MKIHPRQSYEEVIVKLLSVGEKGLVDSKDKGFVGKKEITTIKISKKTVEELSKLKIHPRQAYEEVIVNHLEFYRKNGT